MKTTWAALVAAAGVALSGCIADNVPKERLPRFDPPNGSRPKVALVLGSGGPRGFAHIGVLKVLEENGVRPDLIVGSSVGSMVGALYASGMSARELERLANDLNVMEFFFELRMLGGKLATGITVQEYINKRVNNKPIEALKTPFVAAATRLSDRKLVLFNRGDTGLAVRASGASPGQFEPVQIGGESYVDGDEASPLPIKAARELGAQVVIAVDVSAFEEDTPPGVPEQWIAKDRRRAQQIAQEMPMANVVLHPNIGYYAGHDEAYRRRVMKIAEQYARENLPAVKAAFAKAGIPLNVTQARSAATTQPSSSARTPWGDASR